MRSPADGERPTKVFLNAANVRGRGASILVANLLPELYAVMPDAAFTTLVPRTAELMAAAPARNVRVLARPPRRGLGNDVGRLADLHRGLGRLIEESRAEVCLTLGDLGPARLPCAHVIFLHNPLFVYAPEELAGHHDWSPVKRRYLMWQFRRSLRHADRMLVQTPVMRSRLAARFAISEGSVDVVPQPVPRHVAGGAGIQGRSALGTCPKPIRLLFLASYYGHKNHDILPAVARAIRARGLAGLVQIFVTLGDDAPASLREQLARCPDVVTDLGRLAPALVADALADASALFLPTLVESYGLIYLEAMACGRPILTSDRDFARWMCGGTALYFDPMDAGSIVQSIASLPEFARQPELPARFRARLLEFPPSWGAVAERFAEALRAPEIAKRPRLEGAVSRGDS